MISREDRNDAATLITEFLNGKIEQSHVFLYDKIQNSQDQTVLFATEILGETMEDCGIRPGGIVKSEWDHLERVRLVLLSDAELRGDYQPLLLNPTPWLAWLGILILAIIILLTGIGWHVVIASSLMGLALTFVAGFESSREKARRRYRQAIEPFVSVQQLESVWHSTPTFQKNRFPGELRNFAHSFWGEGIKGFLVQLGWIVFTLLAIPYFILISPILPFIFSMPMKDYDFEVVTIQEIP